jgi:hypothetical protein
MKTPTAIPFSKTNLILGTAFVVLFPIVNIVMFIIVPGDSGFSWFRIMQVAAMGWITILTTLLFIVLLRKLAGGRPALIIEADGITDNASLCEAGFIPWRDIRGFDLVVSGKKNNQNTYSLAILLHNPEEYIAKGNFIQKIVMKIANKRFRTPVTVMEFFLKGDIREIMQTLEKERPTQMI